MGITWSDADKDRLRELAPDHSYNMIAYLMHRSKNAVIGEAHRLHLPVRKPAIVSTRTPRRAHRANSTLRSETELGLVARATPPPLPPLPSELHRAARKPVIEPPPPRQLAPQPRRYAAVCCWPIGDPHSCNFHFCEAPAIRGAYCRCHADMGYVRAPPLKVAVL